MDQTFRSFSQPFAVAKRITVADLFHENQRCGIYILTFANDEFYVGQTKNIVHRFAQHCRTYDDIVQIRFSEQLPEKLNEVEQMTIRRLEESDYPLRNIVFANAPSGDSDLDLIITSDSQNQWLKQEMVTHDEIKRYDDLYLRRRYERKFGKFIRLPFWKEAVLLLSSHIRETILAPRLTELSFWAISCLPTTHEKFPVYARLNLNWQETMNLYEENGALFAVFHVAKSGWDYQKLIDAGLIYLEDRIYRAGGNDQLRIVTDMAGALSLHNNPQFLDATRRFNLRLMRKGATIYGRFHCPQLADLCLNSSENQ